MIDPFPCGAWLDVVIFLFTTNFMLDDGEWVEAEDEYQSKDLLHANAASSMVHDQDEKKLIMRSHEHCHNKTVYKR